MASRQNDLSIAPAALRPKLDLPGVRDNAASYVTYFDHNATSPLLPCARAAWLDAEDRFPGNASSPHRLGSRAEAALDNARQRLAAVLGCSPLDLVFTSGATEACNAVLQHSAAVAGPAGAVLVSAVEHPAVLASAQHYFGQRMRRIPVNDQGVIELDWIRDHLIRERPALVAVMAANNETGVLQPWKDVRALCAAAGIPFFCDATQWCGRLPGRGVGACDFVAGSAHKFGGPRGVGFLKCAPSASLRPLLHGGKQQNGRRAGTENVSGVLAMIAALEWCEQQIAAGGIEQRSRQRERFEQDLRAALPGVSVNGASVERLWNTVSVVMPDSDCRQRWVVKLDKAGLAVSTGSACSSGSEEPSHVLSAMGLSVAAAGRALRFSGSWLTSPESWDSLLDSLVHIQRAMAPALAARDAR